MAKSQEFSIEDVEPEYRKCQLPKAGNNIISCLARMSYPHLQKPRPPRKGDAADKKRKYSVELLIPPEFSLKLLKNDVQRAIEEKFGDNPPRKLKSPFLEAGDFEKEGYEPGWTLIRANTDAKPGVIDGLEGVKIVDEDDPAIYAGRWCTATLRAYYYEVDGNRGISLGLGNVRLMHHDEPISGGGRASAESEFGVSEEYADAKKGKKKLFDEDEEDEDDRPRKSSTQRRKPVRDEDEDEDDRPVRSSKRRVVEEDDEDDEPRRPVKKTARRVVEDDDEDEDDRPARRPAAKKRPSRDADYD